MLAFFLKEQFISFPKMLSLFKEVDCSLVGMSKSRTGQSEKVENV